MNGLCLLLLGVTATFANQIEFVGEESTAGVSGVCTIGDIGHANTADAWVTATGSFTGVCDECDISAACILDCKKCQSVDALGGQTLKSATYDLTSGCHDIGFRAGELICAQVLTGKGITIKHTDAGPVVVSKEPKHAPSIDHPHKKKKQVAADDAVNYKKRGMMFGAVILLLCIIGYVVKSRSKNSAPAVDTPAPTQTKNEEATPKKGWFTPSKEKWAKPKDASLWSKETTGSML